MKNISMEDAEAFLRGKRCGACGESSLEPLPHPEVDPNSQAVAATRKYTVRDVLTAVGQMAEGHYFWVMPAICTKCGHLEEFSSDRVLAYGKETVNGGK